MDQSVVTPEGLLHDRRMMLVDEKGRFVSQRSFPGLSQFRVSMQTDGWSVESAGDSISLVPELFSPEQKNVRIWKSSLDAQVADSLTNEWFSDHIGSKVYLVKYNPSSPRIRNKGKNEFELGFQDGYPLLVASKQEVLNLSEIIGKDLSILRFRPNLVVSSDDMDDFYQQNDREISDVKLKYRKPCVRCKVITIDPDKGQTDQPDLLKKLRRNRLGQPVFGQQYIPKNKGVIKIGDRFTNPSSHVVR